LKEDGVTPELLAMKAAQYAVAKAAKDPKWIKLPQYWLDEECWLEDPQPPKPPATRSRSKRKTAKTTGEAKSTAKPNRAKKTSGPVKGPGQPKGSARDGVMRRLGWTVSEIKKIFDKRGRSFGDVSDEELCRGIAAVYFVMGSPDLENAVLKYQVPKSAEQHAAIEAMTWEDMAERFAGAA
jgi:hypothetical protein